MTRQEHLDWAKQRALEYLDRGDLQNAVTSMGSDLSKHPDLDPPPFLMELGMVELMNHNADGVRRWITGFN